MLLLRKYCDIPNTVQYKHLPKTTWNEVTFTAETKREPRVQTERGCSWTGGEGTQAPERWRQRNDIPTETLEATTATNQRVRGLTLLRPSAPHRFFSHSASSVWGWGGSQEAVARKTSLHGGAQQLKGGWQRNPPSSQGGGESRYAIPHLDCKLSKHKAQDAALPAPTKEAK